MNAEQIESVVKEHKAGPYVWGRRDCITLVECVLEAQGIDVNFRKDEPDIAADSHEEAVSLAIEKHGSLAAMMVKHLDGVDELERVDNPYEWKTGMVGITPEEGEIFVGFRKIDAAAVGSVAGVVGLNVRPWVMVVDKGLLPVSALWPRWKPRLRLAV